MEYKILAVDKSQTLLEVLVFAFEKSNIEVITTDNPKQAEQLIAQTNFDAILYDLDLDGITFVKNIKPKLKNTVVFLMSNHQKQNLKILAKENGADGWIVKPFIAELLGKKIRKFLKYKHQ